MGNLDTILEEIIEKINALPQPTLGLAGGVSRKEVLEIIEEIKKRCKNTLCPN